MSELLTSTSIKNVFDDSYSSQHTVLNIQEDVEFKINKDEKFLDIRGNSFEGINKNDNSSLIGKEQCQMINKELQENIQK